ncbi:hypothetical protein NEQG_01804, partial [Nematocida parisii ERTm3]
SEATTHPTPSSSISTMSTDSLERPKYFWALNESVSGVEAKNPKSQKNQALSSDSPPPLIFPPTLEWPSLDK